MTNLINSFEYLYDLTSANICPIPLTVSKTPLIKWKEFQYRMPTVQELEQFSIKIINNRIGIITGAVSNNIEVIDIDLKNDPLKIIAFEYAGLIREQDATILNRIIIQQTCSGGFHLIYRCKTIEGNQVLAQSQDHKPIIETRGEGGYIVIAPSQGYRIRRGSILKIPSISPNDRKILIDSAKALNRIKPYCEIKVGKNSSSNDLNSPGNRYDQLADPISLLRKHNWKVVGQSGCRLYLRRPEKNTGHSATYNLELNLFYNFSSSCCFQPNRFYRPWHIYAILEHGGNFKHAIRTIVNYLLKLNNNG